jgi:deoxyribodipyrimidine photolyase-related protein
VTDAFLRSQLDSCARADRWILVAPDQLHRDLGAMRGATAGRDGVVLLESGAWLRRRPYHRMRLAVILLNQRAFAVECARAGLAVRYERSERSMADMLQDLVDELGPLAATAWAEREMRTELDPMVRAGRLRPQPHDGWLTEQADFAGCRRGGQWSMDAFYRRVRQRTGLLMREHGEPEGGRFSFDVDNRQPWTGTPPAPEPPRFAMDELRTEVSRVIEEDFGEHPGELDVASVPAWLTECEQLWSWARRTCLPHFGPYEDAMSRRSRGLFHSRMSPLMNVWRIPARTMVEDVAGMHLPIASKEGFIRQVIGWREFVRWVHLETDGFRDAWPAATAPGDGGFARWSGRSWAAPALPAGLDGGAEPATLGSATPLPPAFWGKPSGLRCLDEVVASVWQEGWSHHITRLMVLGNLATLLDVNPRELADWFWIAYMDAWDWVVEPNVLAMATYATGGVMTTKPYVAGSAYIDGMSDYCGACSFRPGKDCPITPLYWAFLERHATRLAANPRMKLVMGSLRRRTAERKRADRSAFVHVRDLLVQGRRLDPAGLLPLG